MGADDLRVPQLVTVRMSDGFSVTCHEIYDIEPDLAEQTAGIPEGFSVWDFFFCDDLFQAFHRERGVLVDVGWWPGNSPQGQFKAQCLPCSTFLDRVIADWEHPIATLTTRDLRAVIRFLEAQ